MKVVRLALLCTLALPIAGWAAPETSLDPLSEEMVSRPTLSPLNFGLDLKYRPVQFPKLSGGRGHGAQIAFEWLPLGHLKHYIGKPAVGFSFGWGQMSAPTENLLVTTYPLYGHLAYRLDIIDNQILVPFAKISRGTTLVRRNRANSARYESWDYTLGVELCLNSLDSHSARVLDSSSGINNTYVVVEWTKSSAIGQPVNDLSRQEWHVGLRFEM
jgi:hypothetical protein